MCPGSGLEPPGVGVEVADVEVGGLIAEDGGRVRRHERRAHDAQRAQDRVGLHPPVEVTAPGLQDGLPPWAAEEVVLVEPLHRLDAAARQLGLHPGQARIDPAAGRAVPVQHDVGADAGRVGGPEVLGLPGVPAGVPGGEEAATDVVDAELAQPRDDAVPLAVGRVEVARVGGDADGVAERGGGREARRGRARGWGRDQQERCQRGGQRREQALVGHAKRGVGCEDLPGAEAAGRRRSAPGERRRVGGPGRGARSRPPEMSAGSPGAGSAQARRDVVEDGHDAAAPSPLRARQAPGSAGVSRTVPTAVTGSFDRRCAR